MSPTPPHVRPRVLLFSSLYPSSERPGHGIFVQTRLRELLATGAIDARVVAPVPWFPSTDLRHGDHARMARTPARETLQGIDTWHPRYLLPPKVGMHIAPFMMAAGAAQALRRIVREGFDFDAIDAHYFYPDGVAAALLAWWFDKPLVVTARGSDVNLIAQYALPRRMMRWAARRADSTIAVSHALAARMREIGMPAQRIQVLRNGVDLLRFSPQPQAESRRRLGWPDAPTLLAVGNLVENKGQHLAVEALAALPEFRLCLVGDGPQSAALLAQATHLGVADRVSFCGRVEQDRLSMYYSAADMLVLPSSREGSPNVVLESMACGTPVVACAVGGVVEALDTTVAGALMSERTTQALVQAVRGVSERQINRDAIRRHAQRFSWAATTRSQQRIFARLAQARLGKSFVDESSADRAGNSP